MCVFKGSKEVAVGESPWQMKRKPQIKSTGNQFSSPIQGSPAHHSLAHQGPERESNSTRAFLTYPLPSLSYPQVPWELVATSNGVLRELSSLIDLPGVQTLWPSGEEAVLRHEAGGSWGVGNGAGSDSYWSCGRLVH